MNDDELLRKNLAIYVSNDFVINKIFKTHHNDFLLSHCARVRNENAIHKKYF